MAISVVIYLALLFGIGNDESYNQESIATSPCEISISVKSKEINGGFLVEVVVKDSTKRFEYFFSDQKRNLLNNDSHDNKVQINEKGEYFCVVVQDSKCHKKIDFKL